MTSNCNGSSDSRKIPNLPDDNKKAKPKNWGSISCIKCDNTFEDYPSLYAHIELKHGIVCEYCGEPFKSPVKEMAYFLRHIHIMQNHSDKIERSWLKCPGCQLSFETKAQLKLHEQRRHPELREDNREESGHVSCEFCKKQYIQVWNLWTHVRNHHKEEMQRNWHRCIICEKYYPSKEELKKHSKKSHKYEEKVLENHTLITDLSVYLSTHEIDCWLKCFQCDIYVEDSEKLENHTKEFHGPTLAPEERDEPTIDTKNQSLPCETSNKIYKSNDSITADPDGDDLSTYTAFKSTTYHPDSDQIDETNVILEDCLQGVEIGRADFLLCDESETSNLTNIAENMLGDQHWPELSLEGDENASLKTVGQNQMQEENHFVGQGVLEGVANLECSEKVDETKSKFIPRKIILELHDNVRKSQENVASESTHAIYMVKHTDQQDKHIPKYVPTDNGHHYPKAIKLLKINQENKEDSIGANKNSMYTGASFCTYQEGKTESTKSYRKQAVLLDSNLTDKQFEQSLASDIESDKKIANSPTQFKQTCPGLLNANENKNQGNVEKENSAASLDFVNYTFGLISLQDSSKEECGAHYTVGSEQEIHLTDEDINFPKTNNKSNSFDVVVEKRLPANQLIFHDHSYCHTTENDVDVLNGGESSSEGLDIEQSNVLKAAVNVRQSKTNISKSSNLEQKETILNIANEQHGSNSRHENSQTEVPVKNIWLANNWSEILTTSHSKMNHGESIDQSEQHLNLFDTSAKRQPHKKCRVLLPKAYSRTTTIGIDCEKHVQAPKTTEENNALNEDQTTNQELLSNQNTCDNFGFVEDKQNGDKSVSETKCSKSFLEPENSSHDNQSNNSETNILKIITQNPKNGESNVLTETDLSHEKTVNESDIEFTDHLVNVPEFGVLEKTFHKEKTLDTLIHNNKTLNENYFASNQSLNINRDLNELSTDCQCDKTNLLTKNSKNFLESNEIANTSFLTNIDSNCSHEKETTDSVNNQELPITKAGIDDFDELCQYVAKLKLIESENNTNSKGTNVNITSQTDINNVGVTLPERTNNTRTQTHSNCNSNETFIDESTEGTTATVDITYLSVEKQSKQEKTNVDNDENNTAAELIINETCLKNMLINNENLVDTSRISDSELISTIEKTTEIQEIVGGKEDIPYDKTTDYMKQKETQEEITSTGNITASETKVFCLDIILDIIYGIHVKDMILQENSDDISSQDASDGIADDQSSSSNLPTTKTGTCSEGGEIQNTLGELENKSKTLESLQDIDDEKLRGKMMQSYFFGIRDSNLNTISLKTTNSESFNSIEKIDITEISSEENRSSEMNGKQVKKEEKVFPKENDDEYCGVYLDPFFKRDHNFHFKNDNKNNLTEDFKAENNQPIDEEVAIIGHHAIEHAHIDDYHQPKDEKYHIKIDKKTKVEMGNNLIPKLEETLLKADVSTLPEGSKEAQTNQDDIKDPLQPHPSTSIELNQSKSLNEISSSQEVSNTGSTSLKPLLASRQTEISINDAHGCDVQSKSTSKSTESSGMISCETVEESESNSNTETRIEYHSKDQNHSRNEEQPELDQDVVCLGHPIVVNNKKRMQLQTLPPKHTSSYDVAICDGMEQNDSSVEIIFEKSIRSKNTRANLKAETQTEAEEQNEDIIYLGFPQIDNDRIIEYVKVEPEINSKKGSFSKSLGLLPKCLDQTDEDLEIIYFCNQQIDKNISIIQSGIYLETDVISDKVQQEDQTQNHFSETISIPNPDNLNNDNESQTVDRNLENSISQNISHEANETNVSLNNCLAENTLSDSNGENGKNQQLNPVSLNDGNITQADVLQSTPIHNDQAKRKLPVDGSSENNVTDLQNKKPRLTIIEPQLETAENLPNCVTHIDSDCADRGSQSSEKEASSDCFTDAIQPDNCELKAISTLKKMPKRKMSKSKRRQSKLKPTEENQSIMLFRLNKSHSKIKKKMQTAIIPQDSKSNLLSSDVNIGNTETQNSTKSLPIENETNIGKTEAQNSSIILPIENETNITNMETQNSSNIKHIENETKILNTEYQNSFSNQPIENETNITNMETQNSSNIQHIENEIKTSNTENQNSSNILPIENETNIANKKTQNCSNIQHIDNETKISNLENQNSPIIQLNESGNNIENIEIQNSSNIQHIENETNYANIENSSNNQLNENENNIENTETQNSLNFQHTDNETDNMHNYQNSSNGPQIETRHITNEIQSNITSERTTTASLDLASLESKPPSQEVQVNPEMRTIASVQSDSMSLDGGQHSDLDDVIIPSCDTEEYDLVDDDDEDDDDDELMQMIQLEIECLEQNQIPYIKSEECIFCKIKFSPFELINHNIVFHTIIS